ncbi:MAG: ribulose-phosphate 3-epimerase [Acidobacteriota bacterium]
MPGTHPIVDMVRSHGPTLSVGLVSANLMALGDDVARLECAGVRLAHFDVMDGAYVPMLTVGPQFIKSVHTSMLKDVHLMVREPLVSVPDYVAAGADLVTIHPDACTHPHRVLQALASMSNARNPGRGIARGVALNPGTPLEWLAPLIDQVELVMLLAINPGWSQQPFIPSTIERLAETRRRLDATGRAILLAVDGGITRRNIGELAGLGIDVVVTGSAVFDGDASANVAEMIAALRGSG